MNSNPYSPPETVEFPSVNQSPLSVATVLGMGVATLLGFVYLTVAGMAVYECLRLPKYGISGYVMNGTLSTIFATICVVAVVRMNSRKPGARWWLLVSPLLLLLWIVIPWL